MTPLLFQGASDVCHFNEFEYTSILLTGRILASDVCHFNEFEYYLMI